MKNFASPGENLDINVDKNMNTSVQENKSTSVGANNTIEVTKTHKLNAKTYNQTVEENKTVKITGDLKETTGTTTHRAEQGDILIKSAGTAKMLGAVDAKVNKG